MKTKISKSKRKNNQEEKKINSNYNTKSIFNINTASTTAHSSTAGCRDVSLPIIPALLCSHGKTNFEELLEQIQAHLITDFGT